MGSALFKLDAKWQIKPVSGKGDKQCDMYIRIDVECTKKIWGVTGMVENMLEKQVIHLTDNIVVAAMLCSVVCCRMVFVCVVLYVWKKKQKFLLLTYDMAVLGFVIP